MLGRITIYLFKLPENTPRAFFGGLLIVALIVALVVALVVVPEFRKGVLGGGQSSAKVEQRDEALPLGCIPVKIETNRLPLSTMRVTFDRITVEDIQLCNPREARQSGKSDVVDVGPSKLAEKGSRVTIRLREGNGILALKDDNKGGHVQAASCSTGTIFEAKWGSFIPDVLLIKEVGYLTDTGMRRCYENLY